MKFINHSFFRYLVFGVVNTGLSYLIYLLCLVFAPYLVAYTISYVSGIFLSYFVNTILVFKISLEWKKAIQYPLVYLFQYLAGTLLISIFVEMFMIDAAIAALLNTVVLIPLSFLLTRFILLSKTDVKHNV